MSLKSTFLAFQKSCASCPNWGEGRGGNLDKIQKNGRTSLSHKARKGSDLGPIKTKKLYHALYSKHLLNIAVLLFSQRGGHLRTKMFADVKFEMATTKNTL